MMTLRQEASGLLQARIINTFPDDLGAVRQVLVQTKGNTLLCRPITNSFRFLPHEEN